MEATEIPINRWMDKDDIVLCVCDGILLSHKKEWNVICIDEPRDYYTKWSQKEKDKYHMMSLTCGI